MIVGGKIKPPGAAKFTRVLSIGIGGSALGPQFVADALGDPSTDKMQVYFIDNTDPDGMDEVMRDLGSDLRGTLVIVVSKSGGTKETRNAAIEVEAMFRKLGLSFSKRAVAVTGEGSALERSAREQGYREIFPMWEWVGGRTSEFSAVGLLPAALQGIDIEAFLEGARLMDQRTRVPDLLQNPAALLAALAAHPDVDMISITGSTRAGIAVAQAAAPTVKRVAQELGGKSPNIVLRDADLAWSVRKGVQSCFNNSGQSCNSPTRMLVPRDLQAEALSVARQTAEAHKVGDPRAEATILGPVVSETQFNKIQGLIESVIKEGATLVTGGTGRPEGLNRGYYVRPTVFGDVTPQMTVAREEIFGPVLSIMPYDSEEQAIEIANDTVYGLSANVESKDIEHARRVARQLRAGQVKINYPAWDTFAPFGGYKQSGNGREYADWGIHDFLEVKAIIGHGA